MPSPPKSRQKCRASACRTSFNGNPAMEPQLSTLYLGIYQVNHHASLSCPKLLRKNGTTKTPSLIKTSVQYI